MTDQATLFDKPRATPVRPAATQRRSYERLALLLLLSGIICLELQFMIGGAINLGNLAMAASAAVAALLMYASPSPRGKRFSLIAPDYVYLAYVLWCGTTSLWSVSGKATLVQVGYLLAMWLGCVSVSRLPPELIARYVIRFAAVLAALSFAMIVLTPALAFQPASSTGLPELRGVFGHQLRLGAFMSVAFAFIALAIINGRRRVILPNNMFFALVTFGLITLCMAAALARSYTAYMFLALPISYCLSKRGVVRWLTVLSLIIIVVLMIKYADALLVLLGDETGDVTLSGRTHVWEVTLGAYEGGPRLRGYGYATFALPDFDNLWKNYRPPHPHNSILAALFETGLLGAVLTVAFVLAQLLSVIRSAAFRRQSSYAAMLVLMMILASLTGVNYAGKPSVLFAITMLFVGAEVRSSQLKVVALPFSRHLAARTRVQSAGQR